MEPLQTQLDRLVQENRHWCDQGKTAVYIPELSKQDPRLLGISICDIQGRQCYAGDCGVPFTIQSISKVAAFICMLLDNAFEDLAKKISVAPSADGFNSIVNLETKNEQRPLNPMINSGAIAGLTMVHGAAMEEKFQRVFTLIKKMAGNDKLVVNQNVYHSEVQTGDRNRSLAYFMKSTGIIDTDVDTLLDVYFRLCSVEVTCSDVARMAAVLACDGKAPWSGVHLFDEKTARIAKAVMTTCGMYDGSGEFAVDVGLPGKSGVSGGIMAASPCHLGIAVFGPALDQKGNSLAGWKLLKCLSREQDLSIFSSRKMP
ncbi:glutaminase A [Desulfonatronum thioautotrophicum]|uniref:glutaminase A n=1 Tax=Desulfonatronum thioautotrophicum TaxID=617001 RepID=UPI00069C999A|nr:glutaminase A [Desulfonatronum thioautotrophicum]